MKAPPDELVGKRISGVVLRQARESRARPQSQLFLCFDDGSSFEFWWGEDGIHPAGAFDRFTVETVGQYMADVMTVIRQVPANHEQGQDLS